MGHTIYITGTDTGVGKTFFTTGVIQVLRKFGVDAVGFKPIECGGRNDSRSLLEASGSPCSLDEINPIWFTQPLAPLAAADSPEDVKMDLILDSHLKLKQRHELVIAEGAGGWHVPLDPVTTMADLASNIADEVIILAVNRLGVINHSILTYRAVKEMKLDCARLILNHLPNLHVMTEGTGEDRDPLSITYEEGVSDLSLTSNATMIETCLPALDVYHLRSESCFPELVRTIFDI